MPKSRIADKTPLQYQTSAQLEEAVQRHRQHTQKLLSEARKRRAESQDTYSIQAVRKSDEP